MKGQMVSRVDPRFCPSSCCVDAGGRRGASSGASCRAAGMFLTLAVFAVPVAAQMAPRGLLRGGSRARKRGFVGDCRANLEGEQLRAELAPADCLPGQGCHRTAAIWAGERSSSCNVDAKPGCSSQLCTCSKTWRPAMSLLKR